MNQCLSANQFLSCSRDWLSKQTMAGPYMIIQLWSTNGSYHLRSVRTWTVRTSFPIVLTLLPTWDEPEKIKYASKPIRSDLSLLLSLPLAFPWHQPPIRAYREELFSPTLKLSHSPPALQSPPDTSHDGWLPCYSKLWIKTLCSHLGGLHLLPHAQKLNARMFIVLASEVLDLETKKVICLPNSKANGRWEVGRVEMGMSWFSTSNYY